MQHANFSVSRFAVMTMDLSLEVVVEWVSALQMKSWAGPGRMWGWGLDHPSCSMSARCDRRPHPHPAIWTIKTHRSLLSFHSLHSPYYVYIDISKVFLYQHSCTLFWLHVWICVWVQVSVCVCVCGEGCVLACVHVWMRACMPVCMCVLINFKIKHKDSYIPVQTYLCVLTCSSWSWKFAYNSILTYQKVFSLKTLEILLLALSTFCTDTKKLECWSLSTLFFSPPPPPPPNLVDVFPFLLHLWCKGSLLTYLWNMKCYWTQFNL